MVSDIHSWQKDTHNFKLILTNLRPMTTKIADNTPHAAQISSSMLNITVTENEMKIKAHK